MSKGNELDIHNNKKLFRNQVKRLDKLSSRNKEILLDFDKHCFLKEGLSLSRRRKLLNTMYNFIVKYLENKNLDEATIKDVENAIEKITRKEDYSVWTKQNYNTIVKKFYKWLKLIRNNKDWKRVPKKKYPPICEWIPTTIKKKNIPKLKRSEILTEDEVAKLIEYATHPRTRALVFMLYETGARIAEIGNMRMSDITKTKFGYLLNLDGKTGNRTPEIINSVPALTEWLKVHPLASEIQKGKDVPLWVDIEGKNVGKHMNYGSIRMLIKRLAKRAGIKKRVYQHLFRHSRATHVLVNGLMTESQCKRYFGWSPSSKQLETYSHLQTADANNAYRKALGLVEDDDKKNGKKFKPKICEKCGEKNEYSTIYCKRCNNALDIVTAKKDSIKREEIQERKIEFLVRKILKEKSDIYFKDMIENRPQ